MDIRTPVPTIYGEHLKAYGEIWKAQVEAIRARFGAEVEEVRMPGEHATDVPIIYIKKSSVVGLLEFLKTEPACDYGFLADVTATDEQSESRFEVVYNLLSIGGRYRIRVKTRVKDGESVPTAVKIWPAANWSEREVFDMYGVRFEGHPDLRRILMDSRWVGHPLRKDYPLKGYQIFPTPEPISPQVLESQ